MFSIKKLDPDCKDKLKDADGKFTMNTSIATGRLWVKKIVEKKLVTTQNIATITNVISSTSVL